MRYIISIFIFLFSLMSAVNVFATENWLSQDFLTAAHKSAIFKKIKNPPFFQLTFDDAKHTVTYSNGFENVIVPIEKKQNHLFIENNFIIYKKTPEVLLVKDIKTKKIWRYKKSSQTFETVLNQYTVVGTYQGNIQFFDDGRVDGLKQFTHYNICYAGDCETQNETSKNLIIFSNAQNENVYVAWQFTTKKTLELYQLKNAAVPGDMPVYKLQKKWMVLKKNK